MPVKNKLTIHQSDQLDYLCELLLGFYRLRSHPFETFTLVVETEGMKQFISQYLSHRLGIISNLNYQKMSHFFWKTAQAFYPELKQETDLYQQKIIRWQLFNLFLSKDFKKLAPLAYQTLYSYLRSHESSAYELALYLGKLFEEYLIYRPQWIKTWDKKQQVRELPEKIEQWQRDLWCYLRSTFGENHRVNLWQKIKQHLLQNKLSSKITLPKHIYFFAINHFPPLYLKLTNYLSLHTYVHLFCFNPCQENWIDDIDTHQLLNLLGKEGRDFFKILSEYNPSLEQRIFSDYQSKNPDTLLHQIQRDILYLHSPRSYQKKKLLTNKTDQSIQIHVAHGEVQELYILKNHLLRYLDEHKETRLEEIGILSPDIEKYLPYIEGIFGKNNSDNYTIPYSILNVKVKNQSIFYEAINSFIVFLSSRFEVRNLLSLLKNQLIRNKINLSSDDIFYLAKVIEKANISWGINEQHRKNFHGMGDAFTWEKGLKNIDNALKKENIDKITSPSIIDASIFNDEINNEYLTKLWNSFLDFYQKIVTYHQQISNKNFYFDDWIINLQELVDTFISCNSLEISEQKERLFSNLFETKQDINLTKEKPLFPFSLFILIIRKYLNEYTSNSSIRKGIIFSNLISMRNIPFKFTAILGLNEQDFPRQDKQQEFNLIKTNPQIGDLSRYQDDCYIFLQTLISTKQVLHLSYIGFDPKNRKTINPSPLLDQLINLMKEMTQEGYVNYIKKHPLHPFSRQYFEINSPFDHYGSNYHSSYKYSNLSFNSFLHNYSFSPIIKKELNIEEFLLFWHSPTRYWLLENLDISEQYIKKIINYDESFSLIPDHLYRKMKRKVLTPKGIFILQKLLESSSDNQSQEELKNLLYQWDYFPAGEARKIWHNYIFNQFNKLINFLPDKNISIKELLINKKQNNFLLKSDRLDLKVDHLLSYGIEGDYIFNFDFKHNNINSREKIKALLLHLIHQKNYTQSLIKSYLFTLNEGVEISIGRDKAEELFDRFIFFTERGLMEPLPLFYDPLMKLSAKNSLSSQESIIQKIMDSTEFNSYENKLLFENEENLIKNHLLKELIIELINPLLQENIFKKINL